MIACWRRVREPQAGRAWPHWRWPFAEDDVLRGRDRDHDFGGSPVVLLEAAAAAELAGADESDDPGRPASGMSTMAKRGAAGCYEMSAGTTEATVQARSPPVPDAAHTLPHRAARRPAGLSIPSAASFKSNDVAESYATR